MKPFGQAQQRQSYTPVLLPPVLCPPLPTRLLLLLTWGWVKALPRAAQTQPERLRASKGMSTAWRRWAAGGCPSWGSSCCLSPLSCCSKGMLHPIFSPLVCLRRHLALMEGMFLPQ